VSRFLESCLRCARPLHSGLYLSRCGHMYHEQWSLCHIESIAECSSSLCGIAPRWPWCCSVHAGAHTSHA
jgi:hypothetical protein